LPRGLAEIQPALATFLGELDDENPDLLT